MNSRPLRQILAFLDSGLFALRAKGYCKTGDSHFIKLPEIEPSSIRQEDANFPPELFWKGLPLMV